MGDSPKLVHLAAARAERAARKDPAAAGADALTSLYRDLLGLIRETERLSAALDGNTRRAMAEDIVAARIVDEADFKAVVRQYERVSWHMHGRLNNVLSAMRKVRKA